MSLPRQRFAVIGNPIAQSRSPEIHARFARLEGIQLDYDRLLAPVERFAEHVHAFFADGGSGLNVTAPFKLEAARLAAVKSPRVERAEAANCLRLREGRIEAENFDGVGLVADIQHNLVRPLAGRRILILGAGGAVRGALESLLNSGPVLVVIANRTEHRAATLAREFDPGDGRLIGIGLNALFESARAGDMVFDVVIEATSAALGDDAIEVPSGAYAPGALAYAMSYGKGLTPFLADARRAGADIADGVGMLVEQAAESFAWWHGVRPATRPVLAWLRTQLPALA